MKRNVRALLFGAAAAAAWFHKAMPVTRAAPVVGTRPEHQPSEEVISARTSFDVSKLALNPAAGNLEHASMSSYDHGAALEQLEKELLHDENHQVMSYTDLLLHSSPRDSQSPSIRHSHRQQAVPQVSTVLALAQPVPARTASSAQGPLDDWIQREPPSSHISAQSSTLIRPPVPAGTSVSANTPPASHPLQLAILALPNSSESLQSTKAGRPRKYPSAEAARQAHNEKQRLAAFQRKQAKLRASGTPAETIPAAPRRYTKRLDIPEGASASDIHLAKERSKKETYAAAILRIRGPPNSQLRRDYNARQAELKLARQKRGSSQPKTSSTGSQVAAATRWGGRTEDELNLFRSGDTHQLNVLRDRLDELISAAHQGHDRYKKPGLWQAQLKENVAWRHGIDLLDSTSPADVEKQIHKVLAGTANTSVNRAVERIPRRLTKLVEKAKLEAAAETLNRPATRVEHSKSVDAIHKASKEALRAAYHQVPEWYVQGLGEAAS